MTLPLPLLCRFRTKPATHSGVPGFSIDEVGPEHQNKLWIRGGFPRSFLARGEAASIRWREGFATTFLERDIPQLGIRIPSTALRRFWVMLAHYHGQTWNASELARTMDVSSKTSRYYLDILSGAFLVRILPPWYENLKKRQVKAPKIYLRDSGLLHHLLGIENLAALRSHPRYGAGSPAAESGEKTVRRLCRNRYTIRRSSRRFLFRRINPPPVLLDQFNQCVIRLIG